MLAVARDRRCWPRRSGVRSDPFPQRRQRSPSGACATATPEATTKVRSR